tara:strand:- start:47 stop:322 length:276 start_codon:yes stop_codon:yes gene_type:complete
MMATELINGERVEITPERQVELDAKVAANDQPKFKWASIRAERDALLAASDYTQVADAPGNTSAWATYRQALRDVPSQSDVDNITWPQEPD